MNVVITNTGTLAVPISSTQGKGFSHLLAPNVPYTLDSPDVTVLNIGDNPSALEEFSDGLKAFIDGVAKLVTFWRDHTEQQDDDGEPQVYAEIKNAGANGLRVLLGSNVEEVHVGAGGTADVTAPGYVEIRELGV